MRSFFDWVVSDIALPPLPERHNILDVFATAGCFFLGILELLERVKRCLNNVEHVGAAQRLRQNVTDTGGFQNGAHATRCDNARTGGSRFEQYASAGQAA